LLPVLVLPAGAAAARRFDSAGLAVPARALILLLVAALLLVAIAFVVSHFDSSLVISWVD
jgi:hypothetical protein